MRHRRYLIPPSIPLCLSFRNALRHDAIRPEKLTALPMSQHSKVRGPWFHRFLIGLFTVLLTLLIAWLIDFVLDDIGSISGPAFEEIEKRFLSQSLLDEERVVREQLTETGRNLQQQRSRQSLLRDSTTRHEQTMRQLVELQRLNVQKGIAPEEASQKALAESVTFFLTNQKADQSLNEEISRLSEQERASEERERAIEKKLDNQREPARKEFQRLQRRHDRKLAAFKLLFLLPLLGCAVLAFLKRRTSAYAPVIYAAGIAILWQTIMVIHLHFPTRYFKYIALSAALAVVAYTLVSLLRMLRSPKTSWLLKQYREAYESFMCPVCEYPIRRGALKHSFWTRRSIRKLTVPAATSAEKEEPYTCPACGSGLFEECQSCHGVRHSLLPFCENCGAEKVGGASH